MMFRTGFFVLAFGSLLAGCGARPSPSPTVNLLAGSRDVTADSHDGNEILVWATKGENGPVHTFHLAADGALRILSEREGATIVTSHGELTWKAEEKVLELDGCEHGDGAPRLPSKGSYVNTSLVRPDGSVAQKVVEFNDGIDTDIDELNHSVSLVGSIGPYLFIREGAYSYACGAHGNVTAAAAIWDAENAKIITIESELPEKDKLAATAKKTLDEADEADAADSESNDAVVAQFSPIYGQRGALRLDVQMTRWACYACSDGEWSSYTRSVTLPTNWIPERMKAWVMPPVVVKDFAETHPEWQIGGWSKR